MEPRTAGVDAQSSGFQFYLWTGMVLSKITNEDPIGLHITQIVCQTRDKYLIEYQEKANRAIKFYLDKPATVENCQQLKIYINECLALCNNRPDSDAKAELVGMLTDIADTVQTGIDREVSRYQLNPTRSSQEVNGFVTWEERLRRALARWEIWGWKNRKPVTDTKTLEGYLRYIHVENKPIDVVIKKMQMDLMKKFFNIPDTEDLDVLTAFVDRCTDKIIEKYALISLQTQVTKITTQVIEDIYNEDDDEVAVATATVYPAEAVAAATQQ